MMGKTILELEVITIYNMYMDFLKPYPSYDIASSGRLFFYTFDEATEKIKELALADERKEIYRFILRELPLKERVYSSIFINLCVYDNRGDLLDRSLCSNCPGLEKENEFHGRCEKDIRFRKGDIVEWFGFHVEKV